MPDSSVDVSFTVAMALSCQIAVRGVSFTVAMALSYQIAVRAYHLQELWLCCAKAVQTHH